jgi:hypothetical protein
MSACCCDNHTELVGNAPPIEGSNVQRFLWDRVSRNRHLQASSNLFFPYITEGISEDISFAATADEPASIGKRQACCTIRTLWRAYFPKPFQAAKHDKGGHHKKAIYPTAEMPMRPL